ncbi:MAG: 1-acyl-sn-glycerol-3-phosphate acyltransferase, partial [Candidatus Zixiibacteriota bacterium]
MHKENIPKDGPFILASNHISLTDPPILGASVSRPVHFMAKKELFKNRAFGALLRRLNAYPVNRRGFDKAAIRTAISLLRSAQGMVIFPEGTRARDDGF